jgi:hypothetical protein
VSEKTESADRVAVQLKNLEAYEPPRIVPIGSFTELTSGAGGAGPDPTGGSGM